MAGYSGTPLWKKLGYAPGTRALALGAPAGYKRLLGLPAQVRVSWLSRSEKGMGFVHLYSVEAASLKAQLMRLRHEIAPDGVVWVSWPKKASRVATDVDEDRILGVALPMGLVDVKVCAVNEVWSGLKLMIRRSER